MKSALKQIGLREFRLLLIGLGAILTCVSVAFLAVPNSRTYAAAAQKVDALQQASVDGSHLATQIETQHQRIGELDFELYGDMANLPVRQVEAFIIGRLQRVSWNNGVELVSVEPATGERVEIFQELTFNVRLSGTYDNLYRWLWEARHELGFVVVKEYGLARRDDDDVEPLLVANLNLASYRAIQ